MEKLVREYVELRGGLSELTEYEKNSLALLLGEDASPKNPEGHRPDREEAVQQPEGREDSEMKASWTKMKSGEWGVRVAGGDLDKGDELEVQVSRKNGTSSVEYVRIFWVGKNNYGPGKIALGVIAKTKSAPKHRQYLPSHLPSRAECEECGEFFTPTERSSSDGALESKKRCWETGLMCFSH